MLALFAGLLAALLLLLAVPLNVGWAVERKERVEARVTLTWLFGAVRVRLHPRDRRGGGEREREEKNSGSGSGRSRFGRRLVRALARADVRHRLLRFARSVLGALRPRDLYLSARIGFDDPADTGRLWGAVGPLGAMLPAGSVALVPDFEDACFELHTEGRVRLIPLQLAGLVLALLLSPSVLRALLVP